MPAPASADHRPAALRTLAHSPPNQISLTLPHYSARLFFVEAPSPPPFFAPLPCRAGVGSSMRCTLRPPQSLFGRRCCCCLGSRVSGLGSRDGRLKGGRWGGAGRQAAKNGVVVRAGGAVLSFRCHRNSWCTQGIVSVYVNRTKKIACLPSTSPFYPHHCFSLNVEEEMFVTVS
jgi:hypothetical protein